MMETVVLLINSFVQFQSGFIVFTIETPTHHAFYMEMKLHLVMWDIWTGLQVVCELYLEIMFENNF